MGVFPGGREVRGKVLLASNAANSDCMAACHSGMEAASVYELGSMS